ncbi:MAG: CPBP family intramembrane metalloprotease [Acidobacteria bacterium]|nr:CPBP family intramembrane metalloprotease [Acidobacteriota bacterium]
MKALGIYLTIAFGFAWLFTIPLALSNAGLGWIHANLSLPLFVVLSTAGPSIAALLTLRITEDRWPHFQWPNLRYLLAGILSAVILMPLAYSAIPASVLTPNPHWSAFATLSVFNYSTLIGGPLGEEPGWRGFALPRLQALLGPVRGSILLGVIWASWHLPLFLCKGWISSPLIDYYGIVIGQSILLAFLFNFSRSSIVVAIVGHALFNTTSRWLGMLIGDGPMRESPSPERVLALSGLAVAGLLTLLTRGRLAYSDCTRLE